MSDHATPSSSCPPLASLVDVLDIDSAVCDANPTMAHVRQCPACRKDVERVECALEDILTWADEIGSWHDTPAKSLAREQEFIRRLHRQTQEHISRRSRQPRRWLPLAAAIVLFVAGSALLRLQPAVVSANELLQRAEYVERDQPSGTHQRLVVRFRYSRPIQAKDHTQPPVFGTLTLVDGRIAPDRTDAHAELARLLGERQNWYAPMSIASIRRWRQTLGLDAHARVIVPSRSADRLILSITASRGELREAQLEFQRTSFRVVRQTLLFADGGMLEVSELARWTDPLPASAHTPAAASPKSSSAAFSRPRLAGFVERTFPDNAEGPQFVQELASRTAPLTRRLKELRALDHGGSEANVDAKALALYDTLRKDLNELDLRLLVLFGSRTRSLPSERLPADWRRRVTEATAHGIRLEQRIDELLTHDDVLPADYEIARVFTALWETVNGPP